MDEQPQAGIHDPRNGHDESRQGQRDAIRLQGVQGVGIAEVSGSVAEEYGYELIEDFRDAVLLAKFKFTKNAVVAAMFP